MNGQNLFLANSKDAHNSLESSTLFPEDWRLDGKGEGFDVLFFNFYLIKFLNTCFNIAPINNI